MSLIKSSFFKTVALVAAFSILMLLPVESMAYVMGSGSSSSIAEMSIERGADMAKVQRVLESALVSKRLAKAGLTPEEVSDRLAALSDVELHQFASQLDTLYPGGGAGVLVSLLVIAVLVLVILKLTDHKIIIK